MRNSVHEILFELTKRISVREGKPAGTACAYPRVCLNRAKGKRGFVFYSKFTVFPIYRTPRGKARRFLQNLRKRKSVVSVVAAVAVIAAVASRAAHAPKRVLAGIVGVRAAAVLRIAGAETAAGRSVPAAVAATVTAAAVGNGKQVVEGARERTATATIAGITRIAHM